MWLPFPCVPETPCRFRGAADVAAAALNEVTGEATADALAPGAVEVRRQVSEVFVEQAQQGTECILVATVRRCRDQQDVPLRIGGYAAQQSVPLLPALAGATGEGAAVSLVHNHELGAAVREVLGALRLLDEIGRHDGKRVALKDRLVDVQVAFQTLDGARQDQFRLNVELLCQLPLPLLGQGRGTEHRQAAYLAPVKQLAGDETGVARQSG